MTCAGELGGNWQLGSVPCKNLMSLKEPLKVYLFLM